MILPARIACIDLGEGAAEDVARHCDSYLAVSMAVPRRSLVLVKKAKRNADSFRQAMNEGIRALVECPLEITAICLGPAQTPHGAAHRGPGHFRCEGGREHFFYNAEHRTRRAFIHGWIVGPAYS